MNSRKLTGTVIIAVVVLLALWSTVPYLPLPLRLADRTIREREMPDPDDAKAPGNPVPSKTTMASRDSVPTAREEASEQDDAVPVDEYADPVAPPVRPASITGHVYDLDGNAISGATVFLRVNASTTKEETGSYTFLMNRSIPWHMLMSATARGETGNYSARSGRDGRYTIPGIRHFGEILLGASATGYTTVHSGEYMDLEGAPTLSSVAEGVEYKRMDFTLYAEVSRLRGRVVNPSRQGVADARVMVAKQSCRHGTQEAYWAVSTANGTFEIMLPCDTQCVVVAYKTGFAPAYRTGVMPDAGEIELLLLDGGSIVGTVRDDSNAPAAGMKLVITPRDLDKDNNPWHAPNPVMVTSQDDGTYAARDLSEEFIYTVQIPYPVERQPRLKGNAQTLSEFIQCKKQSANFSYNRLSLFSETPLVMAEAENVMVGAGKETRVDLTIEDKAGLPATIHGRITDEETGQPATPFFVWAREPHIDGIGTIVADAVTREDGAYQMLCYGLKGPTPLTVYLEYCAPYNESAAVMGDILIGPGDVKEMNYSLHALVTAPVRVVSTSGAPIQGAEVSNVFSNEDGRLTVYGLAPYKTHQLQAWWDEPALRTSMVAGVSAPFWGKPGETVPEVLITCPLTGSLVGYLVLPEGMTENPTGEIVPCRADCSGIGLHSLGAFLSPDGTVRAPMVPPGVCTITFIVLPEDDDDEGSYAAYLEDVVIVSGQETDVGMIVPVYEPAEPL